MELGGELWLLGLEPPDRLGGEAKDHAIGLGHHLPSDETFTRWSARSMRRAATPSSATVIERS